MTVGAPLFSVDVAAELSKVPGALLDAPEAIAPELVRLALACGARSVRVTTRRHGLSLEASSASLRPEWLHDLAHLVDPGQADEVRHAALVRLEGAAPALLAVAASARTFRLSSSGWTLEKRTRGAAELRHAASAGVLSARLDGIDSTRPRLRAALLDSCRHVRAALIVDGAPAPRGRPDALAERPLSPPLRGTLAVPRSPGAPEVELLDHGVRRARLGLPGAPGLAVALDVTGAAPGFAGPAAWRAAAAGALAAVRAQAEDAVLAWASEAPGGPAGARVRALLLDLAAVPARRRAVLRVPAWPVWRDGALRYVSLIEMTAPARDPARPASRGLSALAPGEHPEDFVTGEDAVAVLTGPERAALQRALGLSFASPPRRARRPGFWGRWRGGARRALVRWSVGWNSRLAEAAGRLGSEDPAWTYVAGIALTGSASEAQARRWRRAWDASQAPHGP